MTQDGSPAAHSIGISPKNQRKKEGRTNFRAWQTAGAD